MRGVFEDLTNQKFGKLTAISWEKRTKNGKSRTYWLCQCDCGKEKWARMDWLKNGESTSCGCFKGKWNITHGMTVNKQKSNFYMVWQNMKHRCYVKSNRGFRYWGGKGITVCSRWLNSFDNFYQDMYQSYLKHSKKHGERQTTLDRINNNGNYEPSNVRWATYHLQRINH